ncbi:alpha/beta hydrolase-fold protein [Streptomyces sp900105245]|uniref:Alpha/beta hydrolase-fold protein n=1 Tax=Streptomyces sp. 900105245 TaxID=3154379 RepID=A0ABV1UKR5_9ACTN
MLLVLFVALVGWGTPSEAQADTVKIYVHYDAGWGNGLSIRGSSAPLRWASGTSMTWTSGNTWVWEAPPNLSNFDFKVLVNDQKWSVGGNYKVTAAMSRSIHIYPFFGTPKGRIITLPDFFSPQLNNRRNVNIYLPPSYGENLAKNYPVLYMHDGQNLFDARTAFGGVEWQVDETMDRLVGEGAIREAIVVGINNTADRIGEYTPSTDSAYGGGEADTYLDFIQQTLKPYIDTHYRTLTSVSDTLMVGSSLGGLLSCYAGWTRSSVYGSVGCMSSSFWWDDETFSHAVEVYQGKKPERFYLDAGGNNDGATETARFRDELLADGYVSGADLLHIYDPIGMHNESSWARRLPKALAYLLPVEWEIRRS